jgi:hypothetical protein
MDDPRNRDTSKLALAIGGVIIGSTVALALEFTVGGPFGRINDAGNGVAGALSGVLAWRLNAIAKERVPRTALACAAAGAGLTVLGSSLVASGATGWVAGALIASVGFAGIGAWLAVANARLGDEVGWAPSLRRLGSIGGALMVTGVITAPGVFLRLDDPERLPWWVWLGFVGWLGTYVVYPAWAIVLGLRQRSAPGLDARGNQPAV